MTRAGFRLGNNAGLTHGVGLPSPLFKMPQHLVHPRQIALGRVLSRSKSSSTQRRALSYLVSGSLYSRRNNLFLALVMEAVNSLQQNYSIDNNGDVPAVPNGHVVHAETDERGLHLLATIRHHRRLLLALDPNAFVDIGLFDVLVV